jgi:predicted RNase H-like HicB family nuclease
MTTMHGYATEIFYSDDDEGYIAVVPGLPGCSAFGETEEAALREVRIAVDLWLEKAKNEGRHIPGEGKEPLQGILGKKDQERAFS